MVTELEKASFRFTYQQETAVNQSHLRPPACEEGQTASMRLANFGHVPTVQNIVSEIRSSQQYVYLSAGLHESRAQRLNGMLIQDEDAISFHLDLCRRPTRSCLTGR